jgi:hypothetical protein
MANNSNIFGSSFDKSVETKQRNLVRLYKTNNFKDLAKCDRCLKTPINREGDTILHLIAKDLNKPALELILNYNPDALRDDAINVQNKNYETPLHKALDSTLNSNIKSHEFIDYLISKGARENIPDKNQRIIETQEEKSPYNPEIDKLARLNEEVHESLDKISKFDKSDLDNMVNKLGINKNIFSNIEQQIMPDNLSEDIGPKVPETINKAETTSAEKINKVIDMVKGFVNNLVKPPQKGGHETPMDIVELTEYDDDEIQQARLKAEKLRYSRLIGGDSKHLREQQNVLNQKLDMIKQRGGKKTMDSITLTDVGSDFFTSDDDDERLIYDGYGDENEMDVNIKKEYDRLENEMGYSDSSSSDKEENIDKNARVRHHLSESEDNFYSQERTVSKEQQQSNEIFRGFVKKIMDAIKVDEETARQYRFALKMAVEKEHPELKGRQNDVLKVKEMEKIFTEPKTLKKKLDAVDITAVKKILKEAAERREREVKDKPKKPAAKKESTKASRIKSYKSKYVPTSEMVFSTEEEQLW